jgi:DUF4097 and DUF4098 domain-containing protein YvlB
MHKAALTLALLTAVAASVACHLPDRSKYTRTEARTLELKPGGQLRASTFNGRIVVEGWERDEVSLVAEIRERREGDIRFSAESRDGLVEILAEQEGKSRFAISPGGLNGASFTLRVPTKTAAILASSNGRLEIRKIDGEIDATTSNGSIAAEDIGGGARLATSNGSIRANSVKGGLIARTSNSKVEAKDILGNADLRTSNGRIDARSVKGKVDVVTSNGSITVENIEGDLTGNTSNGGLDIQRAFGAIDLTTSNGSIKAADLNGGGGGIRLATSNGSIDVTLGRAEGLLEATTNNSERSVSIEIPNVQPSKEGSTTKAKIGNGAQPIRLKTTNGKIVVR